MNRETIVRATLPGRYKKIKSFSPGRECHCGTIISIYNKSDKCYTCDRL